MLAAMRRIAFTVATLVLLPLAVRAGESPKTHKLKRADKKLQSEINLAIRKGTTWLLKQQERDGSFPYRRGGEAENFTSGGTSLALLTLLHCGVKPTDRSIRKGLDFLRKDYEERKDQTPKYKSGLKVYETAVTVMVLAQLGTEKEEKGSRRARRKACLEKADRHWMQEMTDWLVEHQLSNGAWGYPYAGSDTSNSQYAVLALKEAKRLKMKVPAKVFEEALDFWLAQQEQEGPKVKRHEETGGDGVFDADRTVARVWDHARGWGYRSPKPSGSMTAAGVAVTAILRTELRNATKRREAERAMHDGLAWLGEHFSVTENPGSTRHLHYYLYGLERAGVLGGVVWMGEHRWYADGARYLVDAQERDGSWSTNERSGEGVVDPCFALLFLARSTSHSYGLTPITPTEPAVLEEGDESTAPTPRVDPAELNAVLTALAPVVAEAVRAEEDGDAERLLAAMSDLLPLREMLRDLLERMKSPSHRVTIHAALEDVESWLADYGASVEALPEVADDPGRPAAQEPPAVEPPAPDEPVAQAPPPVPDDEPAPHPLLAELESTRTLSTWCRRAETLYADLASPEERAALARKAADHAGIIALPALARWFREEESSMARVGIHEALAEVGGWRLARLMRRHARRDEPARRTDALEVIYRCLLKPDEEEPERPFVRAIREFHRLRDRRLSRGILRRLDAMDAPGVAALGQSLYVKDFGVHDDTIAMLAKKRDPRAVPPLVYKMNRFKFDHREQLPAHLALVRIGWPAVPPLIDRLDDKAAGTWISWTLRKITRESTGTQKRKWHEWWKKEKARHPELAEVPED